MAESKQLEISEERLNLIGQDLLLLGQQHRLAPWELCVVVKLMDKWLSDNLGLEVVEQVKK